jgi:hypothetical protein
VTAIDDEPIHQSELDELAAALHELDGRSARSFACDSASAMIGRARCSRSASGCTSRVNACGRLNAARNKKLRRAIMLRAHLN